MTAIARRYAKALFDATPAGDRETVTGQLAKITETLQDPMVRVGVTDPDIPAAARQKVCEKLGEDAHAIVRNFIGVLLERRREAVLLDVEPAFRELVLSDRGEVEGVLETAKPLDAAMVEQLADTASKLAGRKVLLRVEENPDLIGGVRMRVGNTLFDSSVATAIEELERQLRTTSIG